MSLIPEEDGEAGHDGEEAEDDLRWKGIFFPPGIFPTQVFKTAKVAIKIISISNYFDKNSRYIYLSGRGER